MIASSNSPMPTKTPTAAAHQTVAAVVSPETWVSVLKINPAPINPTPVTICAITLVGSPLGKYDDISVKIVLPRVMSDIVLIPTALCDFSLSNPIRKPKPTDMNSFIIIVVIKN